MPGWAAPGMPGFTPPGCVPKGDPVAPPMPGIPVLPPNGEVVPVRRVVEAPPPVRLPVVPPAEGPDAVKLPNTCATSAARA